MSKYYWTKPTELRQMRKWSEPLSFVEYLIIVPTVVIMVVCGLIACLH